LLATARYAQQLRELVELLLIQIRHHAATHPHDHRMLDVVSMFRLHTLSAHYGAGSRPSENVDRVLSMLIHKRRNRTPVDIAVLSDRLMKKARGDGLVYQPTYIDKRTGERKTASTWWVQYFVKGTRFRESSNSRGRPGAEAFLRQRLEAAAQGNPVGPKAGKATFEDLAKILLDDYRANGRRSVERVEDAVGHLRRFFERTHASQISSDFIARHVRTRQQEGAAPATINRELGALRRAFRLAQSAGKVAFRPEISMLPEEDNRRVKISSKLPSIKQC
jgi:hypothetical protein